MRTPSTRVRRIALNGAVPLAVLLAGTLVWQGSHAAFAAETSHAGNDRNAGSVMLTNDGGAAMFTVENLVPGATGSRCIVVTGTSDVTGVVKMYFDNSVPHGLENNLMMKVEQGVGSRSAAPDCAGFESAVTQAQQPLATFFSDHNSYATGLLPWTKKAGEHSRTYKFIWTFDTGGLTQVEVDRLQGKSVRTDIEWKLQNS